MLTIPYDEGWNIYLNGEKIDYFPIFDTFIGIKLNSGHHTIKMKYYPKYLNFGIIASIIDFTLIIIYFTLKVSKRKNIIDK